MKKRGRPPGSKDKKRNPKKKRGRPRIHSPEPDGGVRRPVGRPRQERPGTSVIFGAHHVEGE